MGCIGVTRLLAMAIAVSLTLGAAAQDAEAKRMCKDREPRKGCVDSKDVENGSIDASKHLKHEARGKFDSSSFFKNLDFDTFGIFSRVLGINTPRPGVMIATGSASFLTNSGQGSVSCRISTSQNGLHSVLKRFVASVNSEKGLHTASMSATTSFKVKPPGEIVVLLICEKLFADGKLFMISDSLSAQYYPTEN